jgi:3'-5' exonuclease
VRPFYFDIESRRTDNAALIRRISDRVKPPGQYKKADSIAKWWADEGQAAIAEAIDRTALDGTYGRLASIAWAYGDDAVKVMSGDDEFGMLHAAHDIFIEMEGAQIVAFNGDFDLRFLWQRMIIRSVVVPVRLTQALTNRDGFYDPMRAWAGYKGYISQQDLAAAMGIEVEDKTTGADIGDMILAGDWGAVEAHNISDVETLRSIHKRMTV